MSHYRRTPVKYRSLDKIKPLYLVETNDVRKDLYSQHIQHLQGEVESARKLGLKIRLENPN